MKLRFIYKYKGSKVEHDKFLHCKNQMSNQNLHAIKRIQKRTFKTYRRYVKKITTRHFHATLSSCVITNCSYNLIASSILDILRKKVFQRTDFKEHHFQRTDSRIPTNTSNLQKHKCVRKM